MGKQQTVLDSHQFLLELSIPSFAASDLDNLLQRLLDGLDGMPWLQLRSSAEILLWNPRKELVPVAAVGSFVSLGVLADLQAQGPPPDGDGGEPFFLAGHAGRILALPLALAGRSLGFAVLAPERSRALSGSARSFLKALAWVLSGAIYRHLLDEGLKVREVELESAHVETIRRLGAASEYRDHETGWHVLRMAHYAKAMARSMGLDPETQERILITAPMHDIGKLGIPDAILHKQGRLTAEEFGVMKTHTLMGGKILEGEDALMRAASEIACAHHEHWDSSGYPDGLGGDQIPVLARICSVADVFDALTSSRPYKTPWNLGDAIEDIRAGAGIRFDPAVVDAFLPALPEILRIRQLFRDEVIDPNEVLSLPPMAANADDAFPWDPSLSVGIDAIDAHHRYLFGLVGDLEGVVLKRQGAREAARVLRALDLYASIHFQAEERMMRQYGFGGSDRHEALHKSFVQRLREFHAEMHGNPLTAPFDILVFLRDWLVSHIRDEDTKLRALVG